MVPKPSLAALLSANAGYVEPAALPPSLPPPEAWYATPGRSAADGRLANPVRSGRKQPQ
jgi:hypothetical protein